jgi:hypothetical protein
VDRGQISDSKRAEKQFFSRTMCQEFLPTVTSKSLFRVSLLYNYLTSADPPIHVDNMATCFICWGVMTNTAVEEFLPVSRNKCLSDVFGDAWT